MKKNYFLLVLFLTSNSIFTAQDARKNSSNADLNSNSINLSYGILSANLTYERLWQGKVFGGNNSTIVDLGLGGLAHWDGESAFAISRFGILTGSGRRHLEAKAGACLFWSGDFQGSILPSGSIGYRRQKPGSGFIFRTGIGFPDILYVSFGVSF